MNVQRRALLTGMAAAMVLTLAACSPTDQSTMQPTPSATPIPKGWSQLLFQDFNEDAAIGEVGAVYGHDMRGYSGHGDTSGNGMYAPDRVLSVSNGYLDWYVHSENGQPITAAPLPQGYTGQQYGRWTVRFRSDTMPGYKMAFLLWPDSDTWKDGELDFPEGELGDKIYGFAHDVTGNPSHNVFKFDTGMTMQDWHTLSIEWMPDHLTYTIDGVSKTTRNPKALPTVPMHAVLQVETDLEGPAPDPSVAGHVQVDWISIYRYVP